MRNMTIVFTIVVVLTTGCGPETPMQPGEHIPPTPYTFLPTVETRFQDTVYVPIYSDIYDQTVSSKSLLTATLSIRNTSIRDTIYIYGVDYYDTEGNLVRNYLESVLVLTPLQSAEYIVEQADNSGGTGANFLVLWGSNQAQVKPIFQGVMVLKSGQHALSFMTQGISISERGEGPQEASDSPSDR